MHSLVARLFKQHERLCKYLCAASGSALRCERLALSMCRLSEEWMDGLRESESKRGASGLVLQ